MGNQGLRPVPGGAWGCLEVLDRCGAKKWPKPEGKMDPKGGRVGRTRWTRWTRWKLLVLADRDLGAWDSLRFSFILGRTHYVPLLLANLAIMLLSFATMCIPCVGIFLVMPIAWGMPAVI